MKQVDPYNLRGRQPIASPFKDPERMSQLRKQQREELSNERQQAEATSTLHQ